MCEANAYFAEPGEDRETLIMQAVDQVIPDGPESWRLISIFGEQKVVSGHIKAMQLVEHRIVFESKAG
ncbi:MAG: CooT family nickel-binding protein [Candidatus Adiutrix sp.]|jgi:predicted RNA-binding protein|nr:CooT family nickel-binding protein [Candidatus Adiutrix sp.]